MAGMDGEKESREFMRSANLQWKSKQKDSQTTLALYIYIYIEREREREREIITSLRTLDTIRRVTKSDGWQGWMVRKSQGNSCGRQIYNGKVSKKTVRQL